MYNKSSNPNHDCPWLIPIHSIINDPKPNSVLCLWSFLSYEFWAGMGKVRVCEVVICKVSCEVCSYWSATSREPRSLPILAVCHWGSTLMQMSPWALTSHNRQSVFCCTPSNTQRAAFSDTYHLANTSARTCGHKGGLLQLSSFGHLRTTVTTAAVCLQRLHSSRVFGEEVRRHNSTPPWTTLAASSGENPVFGYVFLCIAASMARHRHTSPKPSIWLPT